MKLIWSNTDNQDVIEYVKQHVKELKFENRYEHGFGCSCEKALPETDSPQGNDRTIAQLPVYSVHIKEINRQDVEDVFEDIEGIYVMHCKRCGEYAVDIDE